MGMKSAKTVAGIHDRASVLPSHERRTLRQRSTQPIRASSESTYLPRRKEAKEAWVLLFPQQEVKLLTQEIRFVLVGCVHF